jgi:hypothetical protein
MSKYGHRTHNWFEAIVNKLGGEECAEKFLRNELVVSEVIRAWREQDGVIYFSVTSDGTTGPEWIKRLEKKGFRVGDYAKSILNSSDFKSTDGITTEIAVLKGELFSDENRITKNIRTEADKRKFVKPNPEAACLIREKFTDKEIEAMGFWCIAVMHEPIKDFGGAPHLLDVYRHVGGGWLGASYAYPGLRWDREFGFVFAVPQV